MRNTGSVARRSRAGVKQMAKRTFDKSAPYQSIRGAAEITGLSMCSIRAGCRSGKIPVVMCGSEYRIAMPLFLRQLENEAAASLGGK